MISFGSITLMTTPVQALLTIGGSELANSRRVMDLQPMEAARLQYTASATLDVRIEWSDDQGATWNTLIGEYSATGSSPRVSGWQTIPDASKEQEVLVRAYAVGSGLLTTVNFVELQYR